VARRKEFQAIIIETTGLADPAPIVFTFNNNALIQDNYRIDSVVCLVDAKHVNIHLDEVKPEGSINEAEHQIAFADRILLNKTDLVSAEELADIQERIKSMNSFAKIIKTERSRAPLDQVLGLNSFSLEKCIEVDPSIMEEDEAEEAHDHAHDHAHGGACTYDHAHDEHCSHGKASDCHDHGHGHGHDHATCTLDHDHSAHDHQGHHDDHDHGHGHGHEHAAAGGGSSEVPKKKKKIHNLSLVSSVGFTIEGLLDVKKFNEFMSSLLQAKAADLFRTKGVLAFADQGDTKFVFQGVHEQINFGPSDKPWMEGEVRTSKMVFIGKNLDYEFLKANLESSVSDSEPRKLVVMHKRG